jgi:hypothetical protein
LPGARGPSVKSDRDEIIIRDRILEFLAQVPLLDEQIETWRKHAGTVLALEEADRPRVLFAAKHELGLFFTLRHLLPDRHGGGHHDGHDADADNQHHHRVAVFGSCETVRAHGITA